MNYDRSSTYDENHDDDEAFSGNKNQNNKDFVFAEIEKD